MPHKDGQPVRLLHSYYKYMADHARPGENLRKYFFRQPSAAVAKEMGMTVSAVDTRTHRALKKLRAILGEETL